jgi:hypothetical protein
VAHERRYHRLATWGCYLRPAFTLRAAGLCLCT